ncbi:MAG: DNA-binding protein [Nitrospirae bacterium]|nr:DNA-binding protein [Nitrospirota bacterium]
MRYKTFGDHYIVSIEKGEEIVATLQGFCTEQGIRLGVISGIGAVNRFKIGLFETVLRHYHAREISGDHEITALNGTVSTKEDITYIHLHINVSDKEFHTFGGHLNYAFVSAACEVVIQKIHGEVDREFNQEIGLNLLKFN